MNKYFLLQNIILPFISIFLLVTSLLLFVKIRYLAQINGNIIKYEHEKYISDWEVTNRLREYIYLTIPRSSPSLIFDQDIRYKSSKEILDIYKVKPGGADCWGLAIILMKMYGEKGFESYVYHMGEDNSSFTHVVTLVEINFKSSKRLIVQDPLFNITYTDSKGEPLDFYQMLRYIKSNRLSEITILRRNELSHTYLCSEMDRNKKLCGSNVIPIQAPKIIGNNITSYNELVYIDTLIDYIKKYLIFTHIHSFDNRKYREEKISFNINKILQEK